MTGLGVRNRRNAHRKFFEQFLAQLSASMARLRKLRKKLADFAGAVSGTPIPYAKAGKVVEAVVRPSQDVVAMKDELIEVIRDQDRKILIIIDDIDRLTSEETRQLFRVIKAVADFPKTIYLLAFDKEAVVRMVEETQHGAGEQYLEKIIQVPFELPLPERRALRRLLTSKLDRILQGTRSDLFSARHWGNVFWDGIEHFVRTPRDVVRLTNTLQVTYPAVRDEVNPVDFVAIEALRVFVPAAYDRVRHNPARFAGHNRGNEGPELRAFHEAWLGKLDEGVRAPVKELLVRLFPRLEAAWANTSHGSDWEASWRRELRICSEEIFPAYFRLAVPEQGFSARELSELLDLTTDVDQFGRRLVEFAGTTTPDGTTRARVALERVLDYAEEEIPAERARGIIRAFFQVGDELLRPEDEVGSFFTTGNDVRMGRVFWRLVRRLPPAERFELLRDAVENGRATAFIVNEIITIGQEHGRRSNEQPQPQETRLIPEAQLDELEQLALQKIRAAAGGGALIGTPQLRDVLFAWQAWAGPEEARQWVANVITDDAGLLRLLEAFAQTLSQRVLTDPRGHVGIPAGSRVACALP